MFKHSANNELVLTIHEFVSADGETFCIRKLFLTCMLSYTCAFVNTEKH